MSKCPYRLYSDKKETIEITLSLGVAGARPGEEPEPFIKRADVAMYEAKEAGGDRTVEARQQLGIPVNSGQGNQQ